MPSDESSSGQRRALDAANGARKAELTSRAVRPFGAVVGPVGMPHRCSMITKGAREPKWRHAANRSDKFDRHDRGIKRQSSEPTSLKNRSPYSKSSSEGTPKALARLTRIRAPYDGVLDIDYA